MKCSPVVELVWNLASIEAVWMNCAHIEPEHFLLAMCELSSAHYAGFVEEAVSRGFDRKEIIAEINIPPRICGAMRFSRKTVTAHAASYASSPEAKTSSLIHRSAASRKMFYKAEKFLNEISKGDRNAQLRTIHLIYAALEMEIPVIKVLIEQKQFDVHRTRNAILRGINLYFPCANNQSRKTEASVSISSSMPYLNKFGRDITALARAGKIGPFFGRQAQLNELMEIFARKGKNNPVLIGEAGVGKTAIVEAFALRLLEKDIPDFLEGATVVEINIGYILAGSKYRGDFESDIRGILKECSEQPNIILFIDELHTIIGAGSCEGQMLDAANMLKPVLARGGLRCIGATTTAEYQRYIESDPALERRFEKVRVPEPSTSETLEILKGLRPGWQSHHLVEISDASLQSAIELSVKFDGRHQLPDKAIDLVDRAAAAVHVQQGRMSKQTSAQNEQDNLDDLCCTPQVTPRHIADALAVQLHLPADLLHSEINVKARMKHVSKLEQQLKERIVGQDEAIETICCRLQIAYAAMTARRGPLAVMLFLGPTGVGKTETVAAMAECLFGSSRYLLRLDMSEFMQEHHASRLTGAPAGYVGYGREGQLAAHLRSRPHSLVLLDEVEKAHPRIWDIFLQIFDEGRIADAQGAAIDARHAIFVMTSNVGAKARLRMGFGLDENTERRQVLMGEATAAFRPEFLNRIDEMIVYRTLEQEDAAAIARTLVRQRQETYQNRYGGLLEIDESVVSRILQDGYSPEYGARHLRRTIERHIDIPIAQWLAAENARDAQTIRAEFDGQKVTIRQSELETL